MSEERKLSKLTGVYVDEVQVLTPPYEEPGVIQEFVGEGITREYMLEPAQEVTGGRIQEFLHNWSDKVDIRGDRYKMKYRLLVRARSTQGAKAKAKTYIRAVNPFSPHLIHTGKIKQTERHKDIVTEIGPLNEFYDVTIEVSK